MDIFTSIAKAAAVRDPRMFAYFYYKELLTFSNDEE
jgi:hypothetical protein